jgi:hypothetical protein
MQLQIMSDLHLETPQARPTYGEFKIRSQCPYLALLGDIGNVSDTRLFTFLEEQLQQFEIVFYLLGNHEPYGTTFPDARSTVRAFEKNIELLRSAPGSTIGRFVFLDRTRFDITDNVTVLGCTLFSCVFAEQRDTVARFASDFSSIEDWTVGSHCAAHQADLQWLNSQVAHIAQHEPHRSVVVFTHHSPSVLKAATNPKHITDSAQVRSAWITDLSDQVCWTSPQVRLWAFGHTNFNCDFEDPQTKKRVLTNQKGKRRNELVTFCATKVVDIDTRPHTADQSSVVKGDQKERKHKPEQCVIF